MAIRLQTWITIRIYFAFTSSVVPFNPINTFQELLYSHILLRPDISFSKFTIHLKSNYPLVSGCTSMKCSNSSRNLTGYWATSVFWDKYEHGKKINDQSESHTQMASNIPIGFYGNFSLRKGHDAGICSQRNSCFIHQQPWNNIFVRKTGTTGKSFCIYLKTVQIGCKW